MAKGLFREVMLQIVNWMGYNTLSSCFHELTGWIQPRMQQL